MSGFLKRLNEVGSPRIGLGCMNLSHGYGQRVSDAEAIRALEEAFEMGYRHFDTATLYGGTANERLLGSALANKRHALLLASKGGMAMDIERGQRVIDGRLYSAQDARQSASTVVTPHRDEEGDSESSV